MLQKAFYATHVNKLHDILSTYFGEQGYTITIHFNLHSICFEMYNKIFASPPWFSVGSQDFTGQES